MLLEQITKIVDGIPHTTASKGKVIYETIIENRFTKALELGFACGVGSCYIAAALEENGGGTLVSVDMPVAKERRPTAPELSAKAGLASKIEFVFHELGYNWYLMDAIENGKSFDFCFLDGAHTWDVDALAFHLVDHVLTPGGIIIFDDLDWTYARSPTMSKVPAPELMRQTPAVRKIVDLLVKSNPAYEWIGESEGLGLARKGVSRMVTTPFNLSPADAFPANEGDVAWFSPTRETMTIEDAMCATDITRTIVLGQTRFLNTREVSDSIRDAIRSRTPYSFIRLGDGEAFVLGLGSLTSQDEMNGILNVWFGPNSITQSQLMEIRKQLIVSVERCDLLGIFNTPKASEQHLRVSKIVNQLGLWDGATPLCSAEEHMHLHEHHEFSRILSRLDYVGIVTPRPVADKMRAYWDIGRVEWIPLPEEYHYAARKERVGTHYPDRFDEIMKTLSVPYPGAVFLVGAGVLGKIYCNRIKELGGIAIDIGSTFDCWAEKNSRGNVKRMRLGF